MVWPTAPPGQGATAGIHGDVGPGGCRQGEPQSLAGLELKQEGLQVHLAPLADEAAGSPVAFDAHTQLSHAARGLQP
jgi:hypothetical protein